MSNLRDKGRVRLNPLLSTFFSSIFYLLPNLLCSFLDGLILIFGVPVFYPLPPFSTPGFTLNPILLFCLPPIFCVFSSLSGAIFPILFRYFFFRHLNVRRRRRGREVVERKTERHLCLFRYFLFRHFNVQRRRGSGAIERKTENHLCLSRSREARVCLTWG